MARTKKSQILEPWSAYILEHIPFYPNFASLFYLADRMQEHPVFSAMYTATSHGLAQHLCVLVKRRKVMRLAMGEYARPERASQLDRAWTRLSPGERRERLAQRRLARQQAKETRAAQRAMIATALQASRDALTHNLVNPLDP